MLKVLKKIANTLVIFIGLIFLIISLGIAIYTIYAFVKMIIKFFSTLSIIMSTLSSITMDNLLQIAATTGKPLMIWGGLCLVYFMAKNFVNGTLKKDIDLYFSLKTKVKLSLVIFGTIAVLSYFAGINLGKSNECLDYDVNFMYGGQYCKEYKTSIMFIPNKKEQAEHGLTYFFILGIPASIGMIRAYRS